MFMRTSGFVQSKGEPLGEMRISAPHLGQALDDVRTPDVLADRHAEANAAKVDRARHRPWREHALFVEHAVVRQVDLEAHGFDLAVIDQHDGVVDVAVLGPGRADEHAGAGAQLAGQRLDARPRRGGERRLEDEILGRIAGDEKLGEDDEIGTERGGARTQFAQLGDVAVDVAHRRIRLGERDLQMRGGGRHRVPLGLRYRSQPNQAKAVSGAGALPASSRCCLRRSAIRKASSNAWSALRRGSQRVS